MGTPPQRTKLSHFRASGFFIVYRTLNLVILKFSNFGFAFAECSWAFWQIWRYFFLVYDGIRIAGRSTRAVSLRTERSLSRGFPSLDLDTVLEERSDPEQTQVIEFVHDATIRHSSNRFYLFFLVRLIWWHQNHRRTHIIIRVTHSAASN